MFKQGLRQFLAALTLAFGPLHDQKKVQNDHLETSVGRIRRAKVLIKSGLPGLRHDCAVKSRHDGDNRIFSEQTA